jgi:hypothetical protein
MTDAGHDPLHQLNAHNIDSVEGEKKKKMEKNVSLLKRHVMQVFETVKQSPSDLT